MVEVTGDRKRAGLWTIGRGSRGLLRFYSNNEAYIIAGTTTAKGGNTVHILRVDEDENVFRPVRVYETEAEIWSIELVAVKERSVTVFALTRRKQRSSAEIWTLSFEDAQNVHSVYSSPGSSVNGARSSIDTKSSMDLEGNAFKITRSREDSSRYLIVSSSTATVLKINKSLDATISMSWKLETLCGTSEDEGVIVDGGWTADTRVFVASHSAVVLCDCETGRVEASLNPSDAIGKPTSTAGELWVPPFVSRITSACSTGENILCIGSQDGSLRAFDIRTAGDLSDLPESDRQQWTSLDSAGSSDVQKERFSRIRWEAVKGHCHWISVLMPLPNGGVLSGDIDGVVRCWAEDGTPSGTFPQHVDTVTSAAASANSFVTISYDGRIALNQVPVAT